MLYTGVIEEPTTSDGVYYENKFVYVKSIHLIIFVSYYAKQKQPGCKKVRGQSEATNISDQKL